MSLQTRLAALITAIGADIKAHQASINSFGYVDEKTDNNVYTLPTLGAFVEATGTEINIAALTVARRYRITVNVKFNLSAAGRGLYRATVLQDNAGLGMRSPVQLDVVGGPGQQSAVAIATVLVPALTAVQFSAGGERASGGFAGDSITQAYIEVERIGAV